MSKGKAVTVGNPKTLWDLLNARETGRALQLAETFLGKNKDDIDALLVRGLIANETAALPRAAIDFSRALALAPRDHRASVNLGAVLLNFPKYTMVAGRCSILASALRPSDYTAYLNAAVASYGLSHLNQASTLAWRSFSFQRNNAEPLFTLANAAEKQDQHGMMETLTRLLVALQPRDVRSWFNWALAMLYLGREISSIRALAFSIRLGVNVPQTFGNLGNRGHLIDCFVASARLQSAALAIDPTYATGYLNLGNAYKERGRWDQAILAYRRAARLNPSNETIHHNCALALLALGRFDEGWSTYRYRFHPRNHLSGVRPFAMPRWHGKLLDHGELLLWGEQGVGDEVMFASLLDDVMSTCQPLRLECDARLVSLFQRSFPTIEVVGRQSPPNKRTLSENVGAQAPLGDLGGILRPDRRAHRMLPARFLEPDPVFRENLRAKYARLFPGKFLVGVSWRSLNPQMGHRKSLCLSDLYALSGNPDIVFISVQYGQTAREIETARAAGMNIYQDADIDPFNDLDGLAAQLSTFNCLVSTSNTTVHLAAGVGVPTLILLPSVADWRWGVAGDITYWYRDTRLLRAQPGQEIASIIPEAGRQLEDLAARVCKTGLTEAESKPEKVQGQGNRYSEMCQQLGAVAKSRIECAKAWTCLAAIEPAKGLPYERFADLGSAPSADLLLRALVFGPGHSAVAMKLSFLSPVHLREVLTRLAYALAPAEINGLVRLAELSFERDSYDNSTTLAAKACRISPADPVARFAYVRGVMNTAGLDAAVASIRAAPASYRSIQVVSIQEKLMMMASRLAQLSQDGTLPADPINQALKACSVAAFVDKSPNLLLQGAFEAFWQAKPRYSPALAHILSDLCRHCLPRDAGSLRRLITLLQHLDWREQRFRMAVLGVAMSPGDVKLWDLLVRGTKATTDQAIQTRAAIVALGLAPSKKVSGQLAAQARQAGLKGLGCRLACLFTALKPRAPHGYAELALNIEEDGDKAIAIADRSWELTDGTHPFYWHIRATVRQVHGQDSEAVPFFAQSLALRPGYRQSLTNLALALHRLDSPKTTLIYEMTIALIPDDVDVLSNYGNHLRDLRQLDQGKRIFSRALTVQPHRSEVKHNYSMTLLTNGDLEDGWSYYENRLSATEIEIRPRIHPFPRWDGSAVDTKVLIAPEQGVGDHIMFAQALPDLLKRQKNVLVEVDFRLVSMFRRSFPDAAICQLSLPFDPATSDPEISHFCPIGTLPKFFRKSWDDFGSGAPFLMPDQTKVEALKQKYQQKWPGKQVIGISWKSSAPKIGPEKSCSLLEMIGALQAPNRVFVNMQYGEIDAELKRCEDQFGVTIYKDPGVHPRNDLEGLAAQSLAVGAVVSTSNTTVHLAGAVGARTYLLLPFAADWRWGIGDGPTIWYRSVCRVRQDAKRDWAIVWDEVNKLLY